MLLEKGFVLRTLFLCQFLAAFLFDFVIYGLSRT